MNIVNSQSHNSPKESIDIAINLMSRVHRLRLDDSKENSAVQEEKFREALKVGDFYFPVFDFPNIDINEIQEIEAEINEAIKSISVSGEKNPQIIEDLYQRLLLELGQIKVIANSTHGISTEEEKIAYQDFDSQIHTQAQTDLFLALLTRIQKELSEDINSNDEELQKRARALNSIIPTAGRKISYTQPQNVEHFWIHNNIENALKGLNIDSKIKYSADEIKAFFEQVLRNLDIAGWDVEITFSNKTALSIRSSEQKIFIPSTLEVKGAIVEKKIAHELGVHVVRSENGSNADNKILGVGTANYTDTEEGIAKLYKEHLGESRNLPGEQSVLAVGLVQGLDGTPRNFKQLYDIYFAYHSWESYKSGAKRKHDTLVGNTWKKCVRTFKGIDTKTRGVCSSKDFAYQQGYIDLVDFLAGIQDTEEKEKVLEYLMQGKFNLFDEKVLSILKDVPDSVRKLF